MESKTGVVREKHSTVFYINGMPMPRTLNKTENFYSGYRNGYDCAETGVGVPDNLHLNESEDFVWGFIEGFNRVQLMKYGKHAALLPMYLFKMSKEYMQGFISCFNELLPTVNRKW